MHIEKDDGSTSNKIVFFNYVPDDYTGMDKLFYSAAKESIVKEMDGIAKSIQVWNSNVIVYRPMIRMMSMKRKQSLTSCKPNLHLSHKKRVSNKSVIGSYY